MREVLGSLLANLASAYSSSDVKPKKIVASRHTDAPSSCPLRHSIRVMSGDLVSSVRWYTKTAWLNTEHNKKASRPEGPSHTIALSE